jgi:hypothetical protein
MFSLNDLLDPPRREANFFGQAILADVEGLQKLLAQHFAGMKR